MDLSDGGGMVLKMHYLLVCLGIVAVVCLSGCDAIKQAMYDRQDDRIVEHYYRLSDCEKIDYVEQYLEVGRIYSPFFQRYLPSNGHMLTMLMGLGEKSGIVRDIIISCWSGFDYGSDESWLELCDLWRASLGCNGPVDRLVLLHDLDPFLATVYDSVVRSQAPGTTFETVVSMWPEDAQQIARRTIAAECRSNSLSTTWCTLRIDSVGSYFSLPTGETLYSGLLPQATQPDYIMYLDHIADSLYVAKVVPACVGTESIDTQRIISYQGPEFLFRRLPGGEITMIRADYAGDGNDAPASVTPTGSK